MIKINKHKPRVPGPDEERMHRAIRTAATRFGLDPSDLYLSGAISLENAIARVDHPESPQDRDYTLREFPEHVRREANRARGKIDHGDD